jgi:hypothetical protein
VSTGPRFQFTVMYKKELAMFTCSELLLIPAVDGSLTRDQQDNCLKPMEKASAQINGVELLRYALKMTKSLD